MGRWQLEVSKMAIYMSFPVALFYYFNQPTYFEDWVKKTRREIYPPEDPELRNIIKEVINKQEEKYEQAMLKAANLK